MFICITKIGLLLPPFSLRPRSKTLNIYLGIMRVLFIKYIEHLYSKLPNYLKERLTGRKMPVGNFLLYTFLNSLYFRQELKYQNGFKSKRSSAKCF